MDESGASWECRAHFLAIAARTMLRSTDDLERFRRGVPVTAKAHDSLPDPGSSAATGPGLVDSREGREGSGVLDPDVHPEREHDRSRAVFQVGPVAFGQPVNESLPWPVQHGAKEASVIRPRPLYRRSKRKVGPPTLIGQRQCEPTTPTQLPEDRR